VADNIVHDKNIERRTIIQQQYKHIHQNTNAIKETEHTVLSLTSIFIFIAFVKPSRGREFSHDHNHDRNMFFVHLIPRLHCWHCNEWSCFRFFKLSLQTI